MNKKHIAVYLISILLLTLGTLSCSRAPSDAQTTAQVQAMLKADSTLATEQIAVQSDAGAVSLSGNVGSETERNTAEKLTSQVVGVKRVINNLQVVAAAAPQPIAPPNVAAEVQKPSASRTEKPKHVATPASLKAGAAGTQAAATKPVTPTAMVESPAAPITVVIPKGTTVSVRLIDPVDTAKNKEGDTFRATLNTPIVVNDKTIVRKDADVEACLLSAKSAGHFTGSSSLVLVLTKIIIDKTPYDIKTGEFTKQGASRGKRTAIVVGGGTAAGAVIGGIVGGGKGAAIGAVAGAAAGTGVQGATKGQQVQLPSETLLDFQLAEALTVTPKPAANQGQ